MTVLSPTRLPPRRCSPPPRAARQSDRARCAGSLDWTPIWAGPRSVRARIHVDQVDRTGRWPARRVTRGATVAQATPSAAVGCDVSEHGVGDLTAQFRRLQLGKLHVAVGTCIQRARPPSVGRGGCEARQQGDRKPTPWSVSRRWRRRRQRWPGGRRRQVTVFILTEGQARRQGGVWTWVSQSASSVGGGDRVPILAERSCTCARGLGRRARRAAGTVVNSDGQRGANRRAGARQRNDTLRLSGPHPGARQKRIATGAVTGMSACTERSWAPGSRMSAERPGFRDRDQ